MIGASSIIHPTAKIHETADVGEFCVIGANVTIRALARIWHHVNILPDCEIDAGASVGSGTEVGRGTIIGSRSRVGAHVFLPSNTRIGREVFIGPGVLCADDMTPRVPQLGDAPYMALPPWIEDGAVVGIGVVLRPGIRVGKGGRVGASSLVTHDVEDGDVVMGSPARSHLLSSERKAW